MVSKKMWYMLWAAAALLLFYGNGSLPVTDSVESNYALTAKEMVLSGDWLSPQIYGHYWFDKPVLFYWLTAFAFKIFGFTEFAARFFSALFGLSGIGLVCWGGKKLFNETVGFTSGLILLSCAEFFLISKSIITDAVLFLFFSGTLLYFYLGYSKGKSIYWYLMYACAALATLTKGPVGFLLPGLIIVVFLTVQRGWTVLKRMRLISGIALFAAIAVPWYLMMYQLHGSDFINTFFGTHNILRATVSEHPKDNVIYYYTLVNILALFPWSGMIPIALYEKFKSGEKFTFSEKEKFLFIWIAVVFLFFQNMATKYLTYTYPILFPAAILLGNYLVRNEYILRRKAYIAFNVVMYVLMLTAAFITSERGIVGGQDLFLLPGSLIIGLLITLYLQNKDTGLLYGFGITGIIFYLALVQSIAIPFSELRSAKDLGLELQKVAVSDNNVGLYGKYPTSAVFYSGKNIIKLLPEKDEAEFAPQAFSWSSKNVMPFAAVEKARYKTIVVAKGNNDFFRLNNGKWRCRNIIKEWVILERS